MDRRVVEFFQRLPADQLVSGGWSKSVLRRSMADKLPSPVGWNRGRPHLGPKFTEVWINCDPIEFFCSLASEHPIGEFVDVASLLKKSDDDPEDIEEWRLRCMGLGIWLNATATR